MPINDPFAESKPTINDPFKDIVDPFAGDNTAPKKKTFFEALMPPSREEVSSAIESRFGGVMPKQQLEATKARIGGKFAPEVRPETNALSEIGQATAVGGAAGLAAPEITKGVGRGAQALGKVLRLAPGAVGRGGTIIEQFGRGAEAAAPSLTGIGKRAATGVYGAVGGAAGETAGQTAEAFGLPMPVAEAARIAGGMGSTMIPAGFYRFFGPKISSVMGAIEKINRGETMLAKEASEAEKAAINEKIQQLRGMQPESEAAQRIFADLQKATADIEARATKKALRLESSIPGIEAGVAGRAGRAEQELARIGDITKTESDIGERARRAVLAAEEVQTSARAGTDKLIRSEVDRVANEKQAAGQFIEGTEAYKDLEKFLASKLLIGEETLRQPTAEATGAVLDAYKSFYNALKNRRRVIGSSDDAAAEALAKQLQSEGFQVLATKDPTTNLTVYERVYPTAYEAVDDLRRLVGKKAKFGEPVTGYEALSAGNAKDLYRRLNEVQEQFIGEPFKAMQKAYEVGSTLLEPYAGRAGTKYAGIDFRDPARFKTNPKQLVNEAFGSRQGVDDLIRLTGNNVKEVEGIARDYVATTFKGKTSQQIEKMLAPKGALNDMLSHPSMANIRNQINRYLYDLKGAEAAAGRGKEAIKTVGKEAAEVTKTAKKTASIILADAYAVPRIKSLILSGRPSEWNEVASIIGASPKGRLDLLKATREIISERASSNPNAALTLFKDNIAPSLEKAGIPKAAIGNLTKQLDDIASFKMTEPAKLTAIQNAVNVFVRQYAIPSAGSGAF
jgi:hypothetical protein